MTGLFHNGWLLAVLLAVTLMKKGESLQVKLGQFLTAVFIAGYTEAFLYALFFLPILAPVRILPYMIQGCGLAFALVGVRRLAQGRLYRLWEDTGELILLAGCQALFLAVGIYAYLRLMPSDLLFHYVFVACTLGLWLLLLWILLTQYEKGLQRQQLSAYQTYLPIVEELVEEVRMKQHDYHNELQSIRALALTCGDLQTLRESLLSASDQALSDAQTRLLGLNLRLFAGFLISKLRLAEQQGKEFLLEIRCYTLQTSLREYELIEYLGILIDNALEATASAERIYASLDSADGYLMFEIKNPGPGLTPELCRRMFQKGATSRNDRAGEHGLGLYKLNRFTARDGRELIVENEEIGGTVYLVFRVRL